MGNIANLTTAQRAELKKKLAALKNKAVSEIDDACHDSSEEVAERAAEYKRKAKHLLGKYRRIAAGEEEDQEDNEEKEEKELSEDIKPNVGAASPVAVVGAAVVGAMFAVAMSLFVWKAVLTPSDAPQRVPLLSTDR